MSLEKGTWFWHTTSTPPPRNKRLWPLEINSREKVTLKKDPLFLILPLFKKRGDSCSFSLRVSSRLAHSLWFIGLGTFFLLVFMILGDILFDPSLSFPFFGGVASFAKSYPLFCASIFLVVCVISILIGRRKTTDLWIHLLESLYEEGSKQKRKESPSKIESHFFSSHIVYFLKLELYTFWSSFRACLHFFLESSVFAWNSGTLGTSSRFCYKWVLKHWFLRENCREFWGAPCKRAWTFQLRPTSFYPSEIKFCWRPF